MNSMNMWKLQPSQSLTERLFRAQAERGIDNLIRGLVDLLPEPDSIWPIDDRAKWLRLAAGIFDLGYKAGDGEHREISIVIAPHKRLQKEIAGTVPFTERQLGRLKQIRANMKERAECESMPPEAAA